MISMGSLFDFIQDPSIRRNLIVTLWVILFVVLARHFSARILKSGRINLKDAKRKWMISINNVFTLLLVIGLIGIWASELQAFVLSIVAIAAAIVIATKELLLSFVGGFYKSVVKPFRVGDRVEIGDIRGEVIGNNFLSIDLLEVGPGRNSLLYTGRMVSVPNALILSFAVVAESRIAAFRLHSFAVHQPQTVSALKIQKILLNAAREACSSYLEDAKKYIEEVQKHEGLDVPTVEPKVSIHFPAKDEIEFIVRVPVPSLKAAKVEQEVIQKFVEYQEQDRTFS